MKTFGWVVLAVGLTLATGIAAEQHWGSRPVFARSGGIIRGQQEGLTVRDYIAIQVMAGMSRGHMTKTRDSWKQTAGEEAYKWADALILARGK